MLCDNFRSLQSTRDEEKPENSSDAPNRRNFIFSETPEPCNPEENEEIRPQFVKSVVKCTSVHRSYKRSSTVIESEHGWINLRKTYRWLRRFVDLDDGSEREEENIATKDQNEEGEGNNGDDGEHKETDKETDSIQNAAQGILALSSQQC